MTSQDWKNKNYFPPFLGKFNLSPTERLFNAMLIFLLGVFIASFKNAGLYFAIVNEQKQEPISSWYVVPFILISFWLMAPMWDLEYLKKLKENYKVDGKFPTKWFILDTIWDLMILMVMNLVYTLLIIIFIMNIWN
jgi:hypothetical protein